MPPRNSPPEHGKLLQILNDTPEKLSKMASDLDEKILTIPPKPGEWSAVEILAHLHGCGEAWTPSIFRMLAEDHPSFTEIHPRQKAKKESYTQHRFEILLAAFSERRETLLQKMTGLPTETWQRGARTNRRWDGGRRSSCRNSSKRSMHLMLQAWHVKK